MSKTGRFVRAALGIAAASGAATAIAVAVLRTGAAGLGWSAAGWGSMVVVGVGGGAWIAGRHARPGMGFVVAVLASMLARLLAVAVGVTLAAWTGGVALGAYLAGLALGFVPLQVYEVAFFFREARAGGASGAPPARGANG